MRRHLTPINVFATVVLVLAMLSTSWAKPVRDLITGKQIKNSSVTSKDVHNGSLTTKDFKKGALKGANGPAGRSGGGPAPPAPRAQRARPPSSGRSAPHDASKAVIEASFGVPQFAALGADSIGFDDGLVYSINIDQDHDGTPDIRYDFRFKTTVKPDALLRASGPVTSLADDDLNIRQTYTLTRVTSAGSTTIVDGADVAPPNLGPRATPNYEASLGTPAVAQVGSTSAFAGPRETPTFADASLYDLLTMRPFQGAHLIPTAASAGVNSFRYRNVMMVALRLPISGDGGICPGACTSATDPSSVVGIYATTSRDVGGNLVQTSRAGLPLVRELVTPLADRAGWEVTPPGSDTATVARLQDPEVGRLLRLYYPGVFDPAPPAPRDQLVNFLMRGGASGLPGPALLPPNDLLKLNLAVPVTGAPNSRGALAGDPQGFPNGRRLGDDVVASMLRLLAGEPELGPGSNSNAITDGTTYNGAHPVLGAFPYAPTPISGYEQP